MDVKTIRHLRKKARLTQGEMATRIGLKLRRYNVIEGGTVPLGTMHLNAIAMAFMRLAVEQKNPELIPTNLLELTEDLRRLSS